MAALHTELQSRGLQILAEGRRAKDALKDFTEALALDPSLSLAHYGMGSFYITQNRYDDALAELDEAISLNPLDAMAWFSRGELHRLAQRYPQCSTGAALALATSSPMCASWTEASRKTALLQSMLLCR